MARPPLPVGTWGTIRVQASGRGFRARTQFRDFDGVTRDVERFGATKGAARSALAAALVERTAPAGDEISAEARLSAVAVVWLAEIEASDRAINTVRRYREVLNDHVLPGVGGLMVREATVPRLDRFLKAIATNVGPPTAKLCRTVLSGMLGLAVRHGAAPTNPLRDVAGITVTKRDPRALTLDEVAVLRAAVKAWQEGRPIKPTDEDARPRRGRPPMGDLLDIIDVLLGTGARIGEVLALRWEDVDLDEGTLTVAGTVVWEDQEQGPRRLVRQDHPKTATSRRRLDLPRFTVDTLLRRRVLQPAGNPRDLVFPSSVGTPRDPGNVRKAWRGIRDEAGFGWVTPHTFRRTVATLLARREDLAVASAQLGHGSDAVTARHYVERTHEGPAVAAVLDSLVSRPTP